jgi:hypothetical protein
MLGPLMDPEMVASLVEGEVLVAANGSSYVSECINSTCFSITRIQSLVDSAVQGISREKKCLQNCTPPSDCIYKYFEIKCGQPEWP